MDDRGRIVLDRAGEIFGDEAAAEVVVHQRIDERVGEGQAGDLREADIALRRGRQLVAR